MSITKVMILASACMLNFNLQAQQRMIINFNPAFDASASIEIQAKQHKSFQIIFNQRGSHKLKGSTFSWVLDTTSIVHTRKLGRYFQQFAFSDTIIVKAKQLAGLRKAFTEVYINRDKLSKLKDDRLMVDGMPCLISIPVSQQNQYKISYRPPVLPQTLPIDQLIEKVLEALKMKSTNPATVNYCMVIDYYME